MDSTTKSIKFNLLPLTNSKKERLYQLSTKFKQVYNKTSILLPSILDRRQAKARTVLNQWRKDITKNIDIHAQTAQEAMELARSNYLSSIQNKNTDKKPELTKNIISFHNQSWHFENHNGTTYISIPVEKNGIRYNKIWLPIKRSSYYNDIISKNIKFGAGQLDLDNEYFITTITTETNKIEYTPETFIGIDLGLNNLATLAVLDKDKKVIHTKFWNGKETRHTRKQFDNYRQEVSKISRLDLVKKTKGRESKWMHYINHCISKEIVEIAKQYPNSIIIMEDLHKFTKLKWNFFQLREMILYKSKKNNILTKLINPKNTSITCNKCGNIDKESRNGLNFKCTKCNYQLHADLNAAINIANLSKLSLYPL